VPDLSERSNSFWVVFVRIQSAEDAALMYSDVPKHTNRDLLPSRGILKPVRLAYRGPVSSALPGG